MTTMTVTVTASTVLMTTSQVNAIQMKHSGRKVNPRGSKYSNSRLGKVSRNKRTVRTSNGGGDSRIFEMFRAEKIDVSMQM